MIYPRYMFKYLVGNSKKATMYHTKKKKTFLARLARLAELKTLKKVWFVVRYGVGAMNESIVYSKVSDAVADARIFCSKPEIDSCMKEAKSPLICT